MSSESPPSRKARSRNSSGPKGESDGPPPDSISLRLLDALLVLAFLALTFLLGAFPLKDTDFWWHLRTGDLIRQTGGVPRVDPYTYTVLGKPWIDLHWLFQVAISLIYQRGGVPALTLAKCGVTSLAVGLLVTAKRRDWPVWVMLTAWLPALLLLGGRMYVRPETLTLLYLSIYLAVLPRIDRVPALALILPVAQVAWVNTQGLFVLGPILLGMALLDAAIRPGSFAPGRKSWWRTIGLATGLTGLACLVNPYGILGAVYPIQLARTMGNPVFSHHIAELTPIGMFIARDGLNSLPLQLHFLTIAVGCLSFLAPILWSVIARREPSTSRGKSGPPARIVKKSRREQRPNRPGWTLSLFRLLLFAAFTFLSWQATRNSHQFAAVVGTVTAWNLGEWMAAVRRRSWEKHGGESLGSAIVPRLAAFGAIAGVFAWVATGSFYESAREGRTIGLGEQPLWFPHEAARFAGRPEMPDKFLSFHIGHASLYEYYHGPERKVFADARLEVIGADLFERYTDLQRRISQGERTWPAELDAIGRPAILIDLEGSSAVGGTLLTSADWRCVWFDPIAAVFVHATYQEAVETHGVDFAGRHFRPEPIHEPRGRAALLASSKGLRNLASTVVRSGSERARALILLGLAQARRAGQADPYDAEPWKLLAQFEVLREPPPPGVVPRFRVAFDPVFDLSPARATFALRRALDIHPFDFLTLFLLIDTFKSRGMNEEAVSMLNRLVYLTPINGTQRLAIADALGLRTTLLNMLGPEPLRSWENLSQLNEVVNRLLGSGRAATAADLLNRSTLDSIRTWDDVDRIATLRLHLGQPAEARKLWQEAPNPPRPGLREARVAVTQLVQGDFESARTAYRSAIAANPELFEACYGLAVLEQDAGHAANALNAARRSAALAPTDVARSAAQGIVALVSPYATSPIAHDHQ